MRILLVNESARCHTGGAHRVVVETLGLLADAGHETALAYSDGQASEVACPVYRFSSAAGDSLLRARWEEILRDFRPDIVQVHLTDHPFFLHAAGQMVPLVRFLHDQSWFCSAGDRMVNGYAPCHRAHGAACLWHHYVSGCGGRNPAGNWQRWQRVARNIGQGRGQIFQVASEFMASGLVENGIPRAAIQVIPLYARPPVVQAPTLPGRMVVASRLVPAKGVHIVIAAMAELKDVNCSLVVAGDGPERSRLEAMVAQLKLGDSITFLGEVSPQRVDAELAAAELVVSPTLRPEPFGLIGPEAMAHGKAIVAFDGGATSEWLQNGVNGTMLSSRTAPAMVAALKVLFANRELTRSLGQRGQQLWREKFSSQSYWQRLIDSFERILQNKRRNS